MESKPAYRSAPLFDRALRIASERAQTCETLAGALGITPEDAALYWFSVNSLRRSLGHDLPPLAGAFARCWYDPTWRLEATLEEFQVNEALASHYGRIFYDPEGGHVELNVAANEVVYAIALEYPEADLDRLRRVCVHACEPENGLELLAANAGKMLLAIEEYRDKPFTPACIEGFYRRLVAGIELREVGGSGSHPEGGGPRAEEGAPESDAPAAARTSAAEGCTATMSEGVAPETPGAPEVSESARAPKDAEGLLLLCSFIDGQEGPLAGQSGDHQLIVALTTLLFVRGARLFPAANATFAFLLYLFVLHRAGYHFSAHVPIMRLLYGAESGSAAVDRARYAALDGRSLPADPADWAVECDGTYDWTLVFERVGRLLVEEQRWVMTKLEGMSRRRDRLRAIIDADGSMNARQKEVLLEAMLHSNAEFTYDIHMKRYAISYPSARSDFGRLIDLGFLQQGDDGVRHFFFAADNLHEACIAYLREHCADAYLRYYDDTGALRPEFRATDEAPALYNRDIGFYEKALLDKMYTEHYDFRRASIADADGLVRRSPTRD